MASCWKPPIWPRTRSVSYMSTYRAVVAQRVQPQHRRSEHVLDDRQDHLWTDRRLSLTPAHQAVVGLDPHESASDRSE